MGKIEDALKKFLRSFPPNKMIFDEGEMSTELYILRMGKVAIIKGGKQVAEISEKGSYIGEMSSLLGEPRSARMETRTSCQFYVVPGAIIPKLVSGDPGTAMKFLAGLANRLKATTDELASVRTVAELAKDEKKDTEEDYNDLVYLLRRAAEHTGSPIVKAIAEYGEAKRPVPEAVKTDFDKSLMRDILVKFIDRKYDGK
ncbi:MAG: Crp/Fnr family transcriptional regulator [Planctomycetota bacterium]